MDKTGRVNPRSQSNSFNFTVFRQKAQSIDISQLKMVQRVPWEADSKHQTGLSSFG